MTRSSIKALEASIASKHVKQLFPVSDPQLAEAFELLHRMESCKTLDPFQAMARQAINVLRKYVENCEAHDGKK